MELNFFSNLDLIELPTHVVWKKSFRSKSVMMVEKGQNFQLINLASKKVKNLNKTIRKKTKRRKMKKKKLERKWQTFLINDDSEDIRDLTEIEKRSVATVYRSQISNAIIGFFWKIPLKDKHFILVSSRIYPITIKFAFLSGRFGYLAASGGILV